MLFVSAQRKALFHAPVALLLFTLALCVSGFAALAAQVSIGAVVLTLLGVGGTLLMVADVRVVRVQGDRLVVRNLLGVKELPLAACAFGVSVSHGRGGPTYTVYATAGGARADIATFWSKRAEAVADRLTAKLLPTPGHPLPDRAESRSRDRAAVARAQVALEHELRRRAEQDAQAQVDAYYRSPSWRRSGYIVAAIVGLYLLAMGAYFVVTEVLLAK